MFLNQKPEQDRRAKTMRLLESLWAVAALLIYGLCAIPPLALGAAILAPLPLSIVAFVAAFLLPLGFLFFLTLLILVFGLLHRVVPVPEEGEYALDRQGNVRRWMLHAGALNLLRLPGFLRWVYAIPPLRRLYFWLMRANIHPSVVISYEATIVDPYLIEIGEGSKIGEWAKIGAHFADRERFVIRRVRIGKGVVIGADSGIFGGVTIDDGALIHARSMVLPGTVINKNEIWSGSPAKRKS